MTLMVSPWVVVCLCILTVSMVKLLKLLSILSKAGLGLLLARLLFHLPPLGAGIGLYPKSQ